MHERKATMCELSCALIPIPGRFGALDELYETLTWRERAIHRKILGLLELGGYWQPILAWIERGARDGIVSKQAARDLVVDSDPERLLAGVMAK
jgi:hypothetical protein